MYKKGEDYKKALNEKKERMEKEKEENQKNKNKNVRKSLDYGDDFEEEDDPLFKVEKINLRSLQNEKDDFLALLNKPTESNKHAEEKNHMEELNYKEEKEGDEQLFKEQNLRSLQNEKNDFLALLNKPTEEVNAEEENKDIIVDNIENDGDLKNEQIGRFKELWDEEEDKGENNDDKKEEKDEEKEKNEEKDEEKEKNEEKDEEKEKNEEKD